jgi:HEAT repeat protein
MNRFIPRAELAMSRRLLILLMLPLVALVIILLVPGWSTALMGKIRGEVFCKGRPLSAWVADLADDDPATAADAEKTLGFYGAAAVPPLVECLTSPSPLVRDRAAGCMANIGPDAVPFLILALHDGSHRARRGAATALTRMGTRGKDALPALLAVTNDPVVDVRMAVRGAIVHVSEDPVPALIVMLKDNDAWVRYYAVEYLGGMGPKAMPAVPALLAMLGDSDMRIAIYTPKAIMKIDPEADRKYAKQLSGRFRP